MPCASCTHLVAHRVESACQRSNADAILAGEVPAAAKAPEALPLAGLRLLLPSGCFVLDGLDSQVQAAFDAAVQKLRAAGAAVTSQDCALFDEAHKLYDGGGFAGPESYQIHKQTLECHGELYDPNVAKRIKLGAQASAASYVQLGIDRKRIIAEARALLAPYDAMIMPAVPCVAPAIAEVADGDMYVKLNMQLLRNTGLINVLDGCAATIPCHSAGEGPVGFMVAGMGGTDKHTLAAALAVEKALGRV